MKRLLLLFFLLSLGCRAQSDSARLLPLLGINFGGQLPFGDLAQRFGPNLRAGGSILLKSKRNWVYGVESNYFFGRNVREDVLAQLKNSEGVVTDNEGYPADIRVTERGITLHLVAGKIFNFNPANKNSGLIICFGVGAMQHKINIYDAQTRIAAVKGNLKKGYDRLSLGYSISQFIGYIHISDNRLLNYYLGVESYQGITKSVRKFNYDTGLPDTKQRLDMLLGCRLGWILPLYKKTPNSYYYN